MQDGYPHLPPGHMLQISQSVNCQNTAGKKSEFLRQQTCSLTEILKGDETSVYLFEPHRAINNNKQWKQLSLGQHLLSAISPSKRFCIQFSSLSFSDIPIILTQPSETRAGTIKKHKMTLTATTAVRQGYPAFSLGFEGQIY